MRTAGVFGDISTDAAYRLRRWIGSVEISVRSHTLRDISIDDARLRDHARVRQVDFEDAIHAGQADDDPFVYRQRTAAQPRARSARDKRNPFAMADLHNRLHFSRRSRKQNGLRQNPKVRQPGAFVGVQLWGFGAQSRAYEGTELIEDPGFHGILLAPRDEPGGQFQ